MRHPYGSAVLALTMVAGPAMAQRSGAIEASVLARWTMFDPSIRSLEGGVGAGVRIGAYLKPQWLFEADISTSSSSGLDYRPLHVRVNYLEEYKTGGQMILGVGYALEHYNGTLNGNDSGLSGILGLRQTFGASAFGRVEFVADYVPSPTNGAGNNWLGSVQLVGGYVFGRK